MLSLESDISDTSDNKLLYFFLEKCNIKINNIQELDGISIEREILLNDCIYEKLKLHIPDLKYKLKTTNCTATQKNAEVNQNGHC